MSSTTAPVQHLRDAARWYREVPAPYATGPDGSPSRFAGWLTGNMVAWVVAGLAATAAFGAALEALARSLG